MKLYFILSSSGLRDIVYHRSCAVRGAVSEQHRTPTRLRPRPISATQLKKGFVALIFMAAVVPTSSVSTQALICEEGLHLQLSPNCPSAQESLKHRVTSGVRPLIVGVTWARGEPEEPVVALEGDQLPQPTLLTRLGFRPCMAVHLFDSDDGTLFQGNYCRMYSVHAGSGTLHLWWCHYLETTIFVCFNYHFMFQLTHLRSVDPFVRKEERAHSRRLGMPKLPMDQVKTAACTLRKTTKGGVLPLDP